MRDLTTLEGVGTEIQHRKKGIVGVIQGAYPPGYQGMTTGGFVVYVPAENEKFMLPFENIEGWEVMPRYATREEMRKAREAASSLHHDASVAMAGARKAAGKGHLDPLERCMHCGRVVDDTWEGDRCPGCGATYLELMGW